MILSNQEIYQNAINLNSLRFEGRQLPIRFMFFLQKNIKTLQAFASEIEEARTAIGQKYGVYDKNTQVFNIPQEQIQFVQKELEDLLNIKQEIPIHTFNLVDLESLELTYEQMQAIIFMIKEEE